MHGPIAIGLRTFPAFDVFALPSDRPPWLALQISDDRVNLRLGGQDRAHAADVLHTRQHHARLTPKLVHDRREALESLRDLRFDALLTDVVAEIRVDALEWPSVRSPPLVNQHDRLSELRPRGIVRVFEVPENIARA